MSELTGQNIIDYMIKGIKSDIKDHVVDSIVSDLVSEFSDNIQKVVEERFADMIFDLYKNQNHASLQDNLALIIQWSEKEKERKVEYTTQATVIEG